MGKRLNFDRSPGILEFWHAELQEDEDDFMTDEEIESAFLSWCEESESTVLLVAAARARV